MAMLVQLGGCSSPRPEWGTYQDLTQQPEAALIYPGSELLSDGGYDAEWTVEGPMPAAVWMIYGSDAPIDDIVAYYDAELAERGFDPAPAGRSTNEIASWSWRRDDLAFSLGHKDPDDWAERLERASEFATLYEVRIVKPLPDT